MDISIIVPLFNEAESLPHLYEWIARVMKENKFSYEIIFVNDGSTDNSWEVIKSLTGKVGLVRVSAVITANLLRYFADSRLRRAMWLSPWTPTCRTRRMRFLRSIV